MNAFLRPPVLALVLGCLAVVACATGTKEQRLEALKANPIDPAETLFVSVRFAFGDSLDRFYYASKAIENVMEAKDYPGEVEVRRWGRGSIPEDGQGLDISVTQWRQRFPDQIDCLIAVTVVNGDGRAEQGNYIGSASGVATALSVDDVNNLFVESFEEAFADAWSEVLPYVAGVEASASE